MLLHFFQHSFLYLHTFILQRMPLFYYQKGFLWNLPFKKSRFHSGILTWGPETSEWKRLACCSVVPCVSLSSDTFCVQKTCLFFIPSSLSLCLLYMHLQVVHLSSSLSQNLIIITVKCVCSSNAGAEGQFISIDVWWLWCHSKILLAALVWQTAGSRGCSLQIKFPIHVWFMNTIHTALIELRLWALASL